MESIKKFMLLVKIGFLSIFGTTKGLANVEEELERITGQKIRPDDKELNKKQAPNATDRSH